MQRFSVIIPFYNEEKNVGPVIREVQKLYPESEVIAIDDGSTDGTRSAILAQKSVKLVAYDKNRGKGVAIYDGFARATGEICVMLDGDGQNDPQDIHGLVALLSYADCAFGYRARRKDTWTKKAAGAIGNFGRKTLLGIDDVRDAGCALRAFKRKHVSHLVPFEGLHRFMAALFTDAGLVIAEKPVNHRERFSGSTKYSNLGRLSIGIRDIFYVRKMLRARKLDFSQNYA
jgi:dolichol-phosphate mannosyltransferase